MIIGLERAAGDEWADLGRPAPADLLHWVRAWAPIRRGITLVLSGWVILFALFLLGTAAGILVGFQVDGPRGQLRQTVETLDALRPLVWGALLLAGLLRQWPDKKEAARRLNMALSSLYRRIAELGIQAP